MTTALDINNTLFSNNHLHGSVASGQLHLVQQLIANGCDPNLPHTITGLRPIHFAASRGHVNLVKYLVESSHCHVDAVDKEGETALLKAAYAGHYSVVTYLLKKAHANPLHQDCDGWTALHNACSSGNSHMVELLVNQPNVNVNVTSNQGHTPLMNAASKGFVDIVLKLLERQHANPILKNRFGESAYDVAAAAGEAYLCQLLEQWEIRYCHLTVYHSLNYHVTIPVLLVEEVSISQRQTFNSLSSSSSYLGNFLLKNGNNVHNKIQHHHWFIDGKPIQNKTKVELPNPSWFWLSDWTVDHTFPSVDEAGWSYYPNGQNHHQWLPSSATNQSIKIRRWIRIMKKSIDIMNEDTTSSKSSSSSSSSSGNDNDSDSNNDNNDSHRRQSNILECKTSTSVSTTMTKAHSIFIGCATLPQPLLQEQMTNSNSIDMVDQLQEQVSDAPTPPAQEDLLVSWESNDQALDCRRCHRWFSIITRKHHCRKCGQVICNQCSTNRALLPCNQIIQPPNMQLEDAYTLSLQPQRICDVCVDAVVYENSITRKRRSTNSIMSECPACNKRLHELDTVEEQEQHVRSCLNQGSPTMAGSIRFVVYKLTGNSTLIGQECVICFEEFETDDTVTRLNCMCSYHRHCISSWFAKGKECPIHSQ